MSLTLEPWGPGALARVAAMVPDASLQPELERLLGHGLEETMADVYCPEAMRRLAVLDGADAGFGFAFVLPSGGKRFASIRIGVLGSARRRGVGSALYQAVLAAVRDRVPDLAEVEMSAYVPNSASEAFAARRSLTPTRRYWLMERPGREAPEPDWPAGITVRGYDGTDRDLVRFVDVFNASWLEQDHGIHLTIDDVRDHVASGAVDPFGIYFAEHAGEAVGFVRGALHAMRGEVAVLGVRPDWRGRGLGRALLRFGTRWLIERGVARVTLVVDGQNERALTLYRHEQYQVFRTRQIWSKKL